MKSASINSFNTDSTSICCQALQVTFSLLRSVDHFFVRCEVLDCSYFLHTQRYFPYCSTCNCKQCLKYCIRTCYSFAFIVILISALFCLCPPYTSQAINAGSSRQFLNPFPCQGFFFFSYAELGLLYNFKLVFFLLSLSLSPLKKKNLSLHLINSSLWILVLLQ